MAQGKLIGWKRCHDCNAKCEVRLDKKGNPYGVCFECVESGASQDFSMGRKVRLDRFVREGFVPLEGTEAPAWAKPAAAAPAKPDDGSSSKSAPAAAPAPKKSSGLLIE